MIFPRFIGLCGHPKSGKSEVQKILFQRFGFNMIDDGFALRDFAMRHLGLHEADVYTQEGKARHTEILGRTWQNREILGELGKALEDLFGEEIMPLMAMKACAPHKLYCFASVRKTQGRFIKAQGGMILGIRNPLAGPSPFAFDKFDESVVDAWIENDAQARGLSTIEGLLDLDRKVAAALDRRLAA